MTPPGVLFFRRFLRDPRRVGAVCPSTRYLAAAMLEGLHPAPGDLIVEYGPGTGAFTEAIANRIAHAAGVRYLGIEREAAFCEVLRTRFPRLEFVNADVLEVGSLLEAAGLGRPRVIISGLPLIFMPRMAEIVAGAYALLQPGGAFRTFSYLPSYLVPAAGRLRSALRKTFDRFEMSRLIARNFPPAFVLRGDKAGVPT